MKDTKLVQGVVKFINHAHFFPKDTCAQDGYARYIESLRYAGKLSLVMRAVENLPKTKHGALIYPGVAQYGQSAAFGTRRSAGSNPAVRTNRR